jgi:hypothetical protein
MCILSNVQGPRFPSIDIFQQLQVLDTYLQNTSLKEPTSAIDNG